MSKQGAWEDFVSPMRVVFSPPTHLRVEDQDSAAREYLDALSHFDDGEIKGGWKRLRERHKKAFWPTIAECIAAVSEVRKHRLSDVVDYNPKPAGERWGGACNCERCQGDGKIARGRPRDGFYRAPHDVRDQYLGERRELVEWGDRMVAGVDVAEARARFGIKPGAEPVIGQNPHQRAVPRWNDSGSPINVEPMEYRKSSPEFIAQAKAFIEKNRPREPVE